MSLNDQCTTIWEDEKHIIFKHSGTTDDNTVCYNINQTVSKKEDKEYEKKFDIW